MTQYQHDTRAARLARRKAIRVELRRSKIVLDVPLEKSILLSMLEAGLKAPYRCLSGHCKTCAVTVLAGEADHQDAVLSQSERDEQKLFCPCVSRAYSGHLVLDI